MAGPAILTGKSEHTGVMRGRDVRADLGGKVDPELLKVLVTLAEINHTNTLAIAELATMQNQLVDMLQGFTDIAENMKTRTDQLVRSTKAEVEGDEGARSS
jgi:hypothetical protein